MNEVNEPRALRTEASATDRMIRIAFDMNDFRLGIFCPISKAMHDESAGYRAIRTGIAGLCGPRQLERSDLGHRV